MNIYTKLDSYGVRYEGEQGSYQPGEELITLHELAARKGTIVRVRWIGGDYIPGRGKCYDLSYVQGELPNGTRVDIGWLPHAVLVPRYKMKGELIEWAKEQGVFPKGVGLLDNGWSILG